MDCLTKNVDAIHDCRQNCLQLSERLAAESMEFDHKAVHSSSAASLVNVAGRRKELAELFKMRNTIHELHKQSTGIARDSQHPISIDAEVSDTSTSIIKVTSEFAKEAEDDISIAIQQDLAKEKEEKASLLAQLHALQDQTRQSLAAKLALEDVSKKGSNASHAASVASGCTPGVVEVLREIELVDKELADQRQSNNRIMDQMKSVANAHAHDVARIEKRLEQALQKRKLLTSQLQTIKREVHELRTSTKLGSASNYSGEAGQELKKKMAHKRFGHDTTNFLPKKEKDKMMTINQWSSSTCSCEEPEAEMAVGQRFMGLTSY